MKSVNNELVVYIHIPKTAGSTVNYYLDRSGKPGFSHVEAWLNDDQVAPSKVDSSDWISGHIPYLQMKSRLTELTSRELRLYTVVREPIAQLVSHYNWLIEIFHRGDAFYNSHPGNIREISECIRYSDNSDPAKIIDNLDRFSGLFLNQQSRVALSSFPTNSSCIQLDDKLDGYEGIYTEDYISYFIKKVSGVSYSNKVRRNVSGYHFDKGIFQEMEIREFLSERHSEDIILYEWVQKKNRSDIPASRTFKGNRIRKYFQSFLAH